MEGQRTKLHQSFLKPNHMVPQVDQSNEDLVHQKRTRHRETRMGKKAKGGVSHLHKTGRAHDKTRWHVMTWDENGSSPHHRL